MCVRAVTRVPCTRRPGPQVPHARGFSGTRGTTVTTSCVFGTPLHPAPHPEEGRESRHSGGAHGGEHTTTATAGCQPARRSPLRDRARLVTPPAVRSSPGPPGGRRTTDSERGQGQSGRQPPTPRPQGARSRVGGNKGPPPPQPPPSAAAPQSPRARCPSPREGGGGERATRERRGRREEGGACVLLRRPAPGAPRRARLSSRGCSSCRFLTASAAAAHSERPVARTDGRADGRTGARPRRLPSEAKVEARRGGGGGRRGPHSAPRPLRPPPQPVVARARRAGRPAPRLCARRWCSPVARAGAASARASPRRPPPRLKRDPPLGVSRAGEASAPPAP